MNGASGGAALSTIALMRALRGHGITSCAVCHESGDAAERARLSAAADGAVLFTPLYLWNRKVRAATWKRPLLEARQLWRTGALLGSSALVARFARAQGAELIHTNTLTTPEGALAARLLGVPPRLARARAGRPRPPLPPAARGPSARGACSRWAPPD